MRARRRDFATAEGEAAGVRSVQTGGEVVRRPDEVDLSERADGVAASLDRREVVRRALSGTVLLSGNGIALQAIGFGVTILFARVLGPTGMGALAFGMTLVMLARYIGGGQAFAGALIRAPEDPTPADLHSLIGLQLIVVGILTIVTACVALNFGHVGRITAVMVLALPIAVFRTPAAVLLERQLHYRAITVAEAADTLTYYAWGLGALALGWGVWAIATAMIARAIVGTFTTLMLAPMRIIRPGFSLSRSRELYSFASRVQAQELVEAFRNQGVNVGIAAIGGLQVLGIWSLAFRFLEASFLLFNNVLRVSFPAMSRIVSMEEDPRSIVKRMLRLSMVGNGIVIVSLVSVAPALVPVLFGPEWSAAPGVLATAGIGIIVLTPVSIAFNGYLWAIGDASTPLRAALVWGLAWPVVTFALIPAIGVIATGIGFTVGTIASAAVLTRRGSRHLGLRVGNHVVAGAAAATTAAAAGFLTAKISGAGLASAVAAELIATVVYGIALLAVDRETAFRAACRNRAHGASRPAARARFVVALQQAPRWR